jgi:hypothetical protein
MAPAPSAADRRRDPRVAVSLRYAIEPSRPRQGVLPAYDELAAIAPRLRRELAPSARGFVDATMRVIDALVADAAGREREAEAEAGVDAGADLSAGGIGLRVRRCYEVGAELDITFAIEGTTTPPLRAAGRVVRCVPAAERYELAIAWQRLPGATQERLNRCLLDVGVTRASA